MEAIDMADKEKTLQVEKEEVAPEAGSERIRDRRAFIPRADIYETDNQIVVAVDVPGAKEDSIDITLEKGILTIRADVEPEEPAGYTLSFAEYEVGDYQRSFKLTDEVDQEKIEATYKEGVLHLYLPKSDRAKTRVIAISKG
jgi:HSP20 family protein